MRTGQKSAERSAWSLFNGKLRAGAPRPSERGNVALPIRMRLLLTLCGASVAADAVAIFCRDSQP